MTSSSSLRLLVLSGPTREAIDPVRYISNASSGRQGRAIVEEAVRRGHEVDLVEGPVPWPPPEGARWSAVESALDMLARARELHGSCDALVGVAAVSDYRPAERRDRKLRRSDGGWRLDLVPNPDILAELGRRKGRRVHIGFALETEEPIASGRRKLRAKNLDWIICNAPEAIGAERSTYDLLGAGSARHDLGVLSKGELARVILDLVERRPPPGA